MYSSNAEKNVNVIPSQRALNRIEKVAQGCREVLKGYFLRSVVITGYSARQ